MFQKNDPIKVDALIVGSGISGLTQGYYAKQTGRSIAVLERSNRPGGVIRSEKQNGFLLEYGPNTILPNSDLLDLIEELDLPNQMVLADPKIPRFIQFQGKLHAAPLSFPSFFKTSLLSKGGRLRLLGEPFIARNRSSKDESVLSFATRRLGKEVAERLLSPFIAGICAGDAALLSARSFLPTLVIWEEKNGSLFKGFLGHRKNSKNGLRKSVPKGLLSFHNGLETLVKSLAENLGPAVKLNTPLQSIQVPNKENFLWTIQTENTTFEAKDVILTSPAWEAAKAVDSFSSEGAEALRKIPYAPLALLHLTCKRSDVDHHLHGFGHLLAPSENLETLGCLWSSSLFSNRAPKESVLFTVFVGGSRFPEILSLSENEIVKKAVLALQPILGLKKHPELLALTRYERAIPQYNFGHLEIKDTLRKVEGKFPGLKFGGNYLNGLAVSDIIKNSKYS